MNGIHDMGGMHGFGKVEPEPNEPVFHAPWEGRVLAISRVMALRRAWNIDQSALRDRALAAGVLSHRLLLQEMVRPARSQMLRRSRPDRRGRDRRRPFAAAGPPQAQDDCRRYRAGVSAADRYGRPTTRRPRFKPGDRVRTRNIHPHGHTRLPRYARGQIGMVERVRGCHVYPDSVAAGEGERPAMALYRCLRWDANCGARTAIPALTVSIDAFEPYLEPA